MSCEQGNAGSSGGHDASTGESEGEDQDDSSSTSNLNDENVQNALENFRQQWQRELNVTPKHKSQEDCERKSIDQLVDQYDDVETKAKILFLNGIELEQKGKLYEAVRFYKRAVNLVPDVEKKLYESSKNITRSIRPRNDTNESNEDSDKYENKKYDSDEEDSDDLNLYEKFQRKMFRNHIVCMSQYEQKSTHISALPLEIILYILRWVVSSDLDLRSLEGCSAVCRGFYVCARDSEIWRLVCARIWGVNCGDMPNPFESWREMYLNRPRLQYGGCYISKTTYFRHGENSFQDQFYRPWHLVEYYRYLRFFPEGKVLMLTTPEEPFTCVKHLRSRYPTHQGVMIGHYRLWNNAVTLIVQRQDRKKSSRIRNKRTTDYNDASSDQTFHLELQIQSTRRNRNAVLSWSHFSVFTRHSNGTESNTSFEVMGNKFPPLWFSRVKSYNLESENAL